MRTIAPNLWPVRCARITGGDRICEGNGCRLSGSSDNERADHQSKDSKAATKNTHSASSIAARTRSLEHHDKWALSSATCPSQRYLSVMSRTLPSRSRTVKNRQTAASPSTSVVVQSAASNSSRRPSRSPTRKLQLAQSRPGVAAMPLLGPRSVTRAPRSSARTADHPLTSCTSSVRCLAYQLAEAAGSRTGMKAEAMLVGMAAMVAPRQLGHKRARWSAVLASGAPFRSERRPDSSTD